MRQYRFRVTPVFKTVFTRLALTSTALCVSAPLALANPCVSGYEKNCPTSVKVTSSHVQSHPMTVSINQPLGYLSATQFTQEPHVSITRIYAKPALASIQDAPNGFKGGCHPSTTGYCRVKPAKPVKLSMTAPVKAQIAAPRIATPVKSHVRSQPVIHAPRQTVSAPLSIAHAPRQPVITQNLPRAITPVAPDGTYWEKVAGPTRFGHVNASEVICKRQVVRPQPRVKVVRPVIGVPVPVPVARPIVHCAASQPVLRASRGLNSRYGHAASSGHTAPRLAPHPHVKPAAPFTAHSLAPQRWVQ